MSNFAVSVLALALAGLSLAAEGLSAMEPPGAPPSTERTYSKQERIEICKKREGTPLPPTDPQPLKVEGDIKHPTVLRNVKPVYANPPTAGTIILQIVVDEEGCVREPKIFRGINPAQDLSALNAIRQWVFLPATLEGKPVRVSYLLTVQISNGIGTPPQASSAGPGWTRPADNMEEVFVFNLYRTGAEVLPKKLAGCDSLGSVSATIPEVEGSAGLFNPSVLLPTLKGRAARKSANTVVVSFVPRASELNRRTLRGTAFRCGTEPLPPELGEPMR